MTRCALALMAATVFASAAVAQGMPRNFPATALRGEITFGQPPVIKLNGIDARLAPGARIRGPNNMLQMSGSLVGQTGVVNYTLDPTGLVLDVWLLSSDEQARKPWPRTLEQAKTWSFDPVAQVWSPR
ncbi:MAG: hypothetical protein U1E89_12130 [Burkholderiaceae bacterium]